MTSFSNNWKTDLANYDNGFFRNSQLGNLEKNISDIDLGVLISLENKCFDLSDSKEDYCTRLKKLQECLMPNESQPIEPPAKESDLDNSELDIEIIEASKDVAPKDVVQEAIRLRQNWLAHNLTDEIIGEGDLISEIPETKPLISLSSGAAASSSSSKTTSENDRERQKRLNSKSLLFDFKQQKRRFRG